MYIAENGGTKECYDCSTFHGDKYCGDPFNATHPDVKTIRCNGACGKWVRIPAGGGAPHHYVRTCSSSINLAMPVSLVCMKESRPGDGHLCFCKKSRCNDSTSLHRRSSTLPALILSFMTLLLIQRFFSGYTSVTTWWSTECTVTLVVVVYLLSTQMAPRPLAGMLSDVISWMWRPLVAGEIWRPLARG
jgi:hypothetical protein